MSYVEFYNDAVNHEINLKDDFLMWTQSRMNREFQGFSFAQYPWILDANSKGVFMKLENGVLMRREIQGHGHGFFGLMNPFSHLTIRRENLLEETLSQLQLQEFNAKKPLKVHFVGELGVDEGGVKKEFFQLIIRELFDPSFSMFRHYESAQVYWFNPSTIEGSLNFELIGTLIAMAIYNSVIVDVHFPLALYKKLLGKPTAIEDLQEIDSELVHGLTQLLNYSGDVENDLLRNFTIETEAFGELIAHELVPGGAQRAVTNANRGEFVDLYTDWILNKGIQPLFESFKKGFFKVCDCEVLRLFRAEELDLLVCGNPVLDFHDLQRVTKCLDGYTVDSPQIKWFWEIVHSLGDEDKRKLLSFCTGSDRAPINGLGSMVFKISRNGPDSDRLLTAHTCFNHVLLPEYSSKEKMRKLLLMAIQNSEGFGLR